MKSRVTSNSLQLRRVCQQTHHLKNPRRNLVRLELSAIILSCNCRWANRELLTSISRISATVITIVIVWHCREGFWQSVPACNVQLSVIAYRNELKVEQSYSFLVVYWCNTCTIPDICHISIHIHSFQPISSALILLIHILRLRLIRIACYLGILSNHLSIFYNSRLQISIKQCWFSPKVLNTHDRRIEKDLAKLGLANRNAIPHIWNRSGFRPVTLYNTDTTLVKTDIDT